MRLSFFLALFALLSGMARAQTPADSLALSALAVSGDDVPRIDGRLDEPVWRRAPHADDFVQRAPEPGEPASERTEVAVLYDDDAVYVGFKAWVEDPSTLVARLSRRDAFVGSDRVSVSFDSYDDDRTAFFFGVTAAGVEQDLLFYNDDQEDASWDAVWDGRAARFDDATGTGYTVEMRIPFSQLRYETGAGPEVWGVQFQRVVAATDEQAYWAPVLPDVNGFVSRFGRLDGLDVQRAPRQIEIQPYAVTKLDRAPGDAANPFYASNDLAPNAGFDAKVGLTSNLTLTATINPDFGQVEADPAVVNLSQYETRLSERRPFFVEGVDIFNYGRTLTNNTSYRPTFFYSRRIGRSPVRGIGGDDVAYVDAPRQTTIAGAAKLSGKIGPWSVGVLDAVTLDETAQWVDTLGVHESTPVEPLSNYLVGRVRRDFRQGGTVVGGIATATNRRMGDDGLFDDLAASSAYLGGVDFEHRFAERRWSVSGVAAASSVAGSPGFVTRLQNRPQRYYGRPDADYLRVDSVQTNMRGLFGEMSVQRSVDGSWDASLTANVVTPGFELNDLGFQSRADIASINYFVGHRQPEPTRLRRYSFFHYGGAGFNFGGDLVNHYYGGGFWAEFKNRWGANMRVNYGAPRKNDRLTRGGPLAARPTDLGVHLRVSTDGSKRVSGAFWGNVRSELPNDYAGAAAEYDRYLGFEATIRPSGALSVSVGPSYGRERDNDQFVAAIDDPLATATYGTRYVFSDIRQQALSVALRADWTFTPNLSLQLYAEPGMRTVRYSNYKEFTTPGSFDFDVYGVHRGAATANLDDEGMVDHYTIDPGDGGDAFDVHDVDFSFRSLRGNAVLRWEYRPGSTLFVVWQQVRNERSYYDGFDMGDVFRAPVQNVFLVKLSYWLGV